MAPPVKPDKILHRAVVRGEIRKELVNAVSGGQVKVTRERGRQRRSVEKVKTNERIRERQASEAARIEAAAQKAAIQSAAKEQQRLQRVQTAKDLAALSNEQRAAREPNAGQKVVSNIGGNVTGSSAWSTLMLIVTLFFVMIFVYLIVVNGQAFGGVASKVGVFIASLSSNNPLFISNNPTNATPAKAVATSPSGSSNTQVS